MNRHDCRKLLASCVDASGAIFRMWGSVPLGFALVCRFYEDDPWTTVSELAEGLEASEDTIRRKLEVLAKVGRVKVKKKGRRTFYKAHRDHAARTLQIVKDFILHAKCGEHFR